MHRTIFKFAILFGTLASPAFGDPTMTVVPGGIQDGNWVWRVDIIPDFDLVTDGGRTPVAVELGFRLTGSPLLSVMNINPLEFDSAIPGSVIFGWETLDPAANNHPVGLQVNHSTGEIFAAFGSVNFTTPGPKPFLEIVAEGPTGNGTWLNTLEWLGAYDGNGRIAQLIPDGAGNFDVVPGFVGGSQTQMALVVPEPSTAGLLCLALLALGIASRKDGQQHISQLRG